VKGTRWVALPGTPVLTEFVPVSLLFTAAHVGDDTGMVMKTKSFSGNGEREGEAHARTDSELSGIRPRPT
jgi:hypothetical protein